MGCFDAKQLSENSVPKNVIDSSEVVDLEMALSRPSVSLEKISREISIVPLETNSESILSNVKKVAVSDRYIYIIDNFNGGRVSVFTIDGKFVRNLAQGQGPGEYLKAQSLHWNSSVQKLYVFDESIQKILVYSPDGIFEDGFMINGWNTDAIILDNGILASQSSRTNSSHVMMVGLCNSNGSRGLNWNLGGSLVKIVDSQSDFQYYDGGYLISKPYDNSIYYYKNSQVYRRYLLALPQNGSYGQFDDFSKLRAVMTDQDCFFEGRNYETSNYLLITYMQKKAAGVIAFNKKTDASYRLSVGDPNFVLARMQIKNVVSAGNDRLVGVVDIGMFGMSKFPVWSNPNNLISPSDMEKLRNVKPDDNPIIVLFKLKSDI